MMTAEDFLKGILAGDRLTLSKAITVIESTHPDHRTLARNLIQRCMPHTGNALRIGITGAPGVGKSTFIDALGMALVEAGKRIAVLAIDPSSQKTSGSILGDKTRMQNLSQHKNAYIRPSPNSGSLGGIASRTREAMLLCEAAGFDIIFVETVGVGQAEFSVHQMVDMLLLLMITGAGDDLQGIKRGIMEMTDLIVINKADGDNVPAAKQLKRLIRQTTHALPPPRPDWSTEIVTVSSLNHTGIDEVTAQIEAFEMAMRAAGAFTTNRQSQSLAWMQQHIEEGLMRMLTDDQAIADQFKALQAEVSAGTVNPVDAAEAILARLSGKAKNQR